jgi:Flp pilus assembly protein TadG
MSLQLLVILVPVIFGFMGFAMDLGRLWLIRGELNQAANAMALAAAAQMAGATLSAAANMSSAANQALNEANGNRYNFGSTIIPEGTVTCFNSIDAASTNDATATTDCGATDVKAVQATISAPAPLLFFSLLPGGESRTTTVASFAVAGMSAPLCTGCGIVPIAVQMPDTTGADQDNWGFVPGGLYTFYYSCTGTTPTPIVGTAVPYVILNRVNPDLDEATQMVQQGARGIAGSQVATPNACTASPTMPISCASIGDVEQIPQSGSATPGQCSATTAQTDVTYVLCGLYSRMSTDVLGPCADYSATLANYTADTDATYVTDPTGYQGNGRRILTVAVVNALASDTTCGAMTVMGFRQFLLDPAADGSYTPTDANGRFAALYLGSVAPVAQGWFDTRFATACRSYLTTGPGKVVLHQ